MNISMDESWHHGPSHAVDDNGIYMVTAGVYRKECLFSDDEKLRFLHDTMHAVTKEYGWDLHAWAVLANHYHFIAKSQNDPLSLRKLLRKFHAVSAKWLNEQDRVQGRKVWHQYWETQLTFERSYLARLHYVNTNPVRHGIVGDASLYRWCSAAHFAVTQPLSYQRTVADMPTDQLSVADDF